ncbi:MAG: BhlA/UviB family holin-like peptide [Clostridium butyricum]|uniref:BhlA/UviB family holin-like peptide n=1 Tax=Clostridium TaxID=1485 RepID=UPI0006C5F63F|nr:BhlA/UviB family holin-like peptide [Clostridium paraputrificum]CUO89374.1 UviB-like protein [Clostridium paraputrificum]
MSDEIIQIVSSQGVWALLSFLLIYYIVKAQEKRDEKQDEREKNYQVLISELTEKFELIHSDVSEIKEKLNI